MLIEAPEPHSCNLPTIRDAGVRDLARGSLYRCEHPECERKWIVVGDEWDGKRWARLRWHHRSPAATGQVPGLRRAQRSWGTLRSVDLWSTVLCLMLAVWYIALLVMAMTP